MIYGIKYMIIGLCGKKGSGKSTAAKYLTEKYGTSRVNFKDALVTEIKKNFNPMLLAVIDLLEREDYDGNCALTIDQLFDKKPPVIRTLMQCYGTEVRRADNENYWKNKWIVSTMEKGGRIVCDDVRFLNEADAVKNVGGFIIKIEREGLVSNDSHKSETEMDHINYDYVITVPDGDIDTLHRKLDEIMEVLIKGDDEDG